jgi:hypothetical protein
VLPSTPCKVTCRFPMVLRPVFPPTSR